MNQRNVLTNVSMAVYLDRHVTHNIVYLTIIASVLAFAACMPIILIDVSVNSPGVLRPIAASTPIRAFASGVVASVAVQENSVVKRGDLLLNVYSPQLVERKDFAHHRLSEMLELVRDVEGLASLVRGGEAALQSTWRPATTLYGALLSDFQQRYRDADAHLSKVLKDHARSKVLHAGGAIAASDMEAADETLREASDARKRIVQGQLTECEQQALKYNQETSDLREALAGIAHEEELMNIVAPVSGSVQRLAGIYPGSVVFSGQEIGHISPDTTLVAEVYVAPRDIGLIREQMPVRLQLAAYNYNEWGLLDAKVLRVSDDVIITSEQAHYVVVCGVAKAFLELSNGYRGDLRKGMSVQARFIVARRSLWQLLYDKTDDWLNPHH